MSIDYETRRLDDLLLNARECAINQVEFARRNWIETSGYQKLMLEQNRCVWQGMLAGCLLRSDDFRLCPFPFSVWEVESGDSEPILRANQSTLFGALGFMKEGRVLVRNKNFQARKENPAIVRRVKV